MTINYIVFAFIASFLWATVNHIDKLIVTKVSEEGKVGPLVLFSALAGLPVIVLIPFWLNPFEGINTKTLLDYTLLSITGVLYIISVIPYLKALDISDVSSVVPQLLMITPIASALSYFVLGEYMTYQQIIGGAIIFIGVIFINADEITLKIGWRALFYMLMASICIAINTVGFKFLAEKFDTFWISIFWEHIGFMVFFVAVMAFPNRYRQDFIHLLKTKGKYAISINMIGETLTLIGNFSFHYATLLAPVAFTHILAEGLQPVIAILLSVVTPIIGLPFIVETRNFRYISIKVISIIVILGGLYYSTYNG